MTAEASRGGDPAPAPSPSSNASSSPASKSGASFADLAELPGAEVFPTVSGTASPPTIAAGQSLEPTRPMPKAPTPSLPPTDAQLGQASGTTDDAVVRAACSTCGAYHSSLDGPAFHESFGCADGNCVPGRQPCNLPCHNCDNFMTAFIDNLYMSICCPDPCYQPKWVPAANASLFADYARPRTVTRLRYDNLINMVRPDRNQFFFQTVHPGGNFKINGVTYRTDPSLNFQQLYLYQEAAGERGSFFVEIPYRQVDPLFSPTQAGFGDINFGIKSLMFDTEMLQTSFQFRTYTPSGNAMQALGTGHFSLDPSILLSLKLGPETYFQSQIGQWIPLGGTSPIAGGVLYWFNSVNHVLLHCTPDSPLIGTLEMTGWSFENGGWTKPVVTNAPAMHGTPANVVTSGGGVSYFNIGPGLRLSICNRIDIGSAITWATTGPQWGSPWFRFEVRFLF
jgi:hypothetical protein